MMKFAKFFAYLTACIGLMGCEPLSLEKHTFLYNEMCIDGVIYLRSPNGNLTPKVNADFYPHTCEIQGANNG
ncbi:hypothetical protein A1D29_10475 [Pasteurellaceae bacterium Orientalotternb1]|nr:hypothetical protein A1D29_10475 [Pasteurellaceae bacterium Orientalotternb1]